jgi:catalase (peroxidase I)
MLGQAVQTVMKTETMLTDMARQFPAAAPSLRAAVDGLRTAGTGLRAALRQVLTSPGQAEPPTPAIGG